MTTDLMTTGQRIGDVKVLIQLVREYGFRGLILSDDADPGAVRAMHKLLDSADWLCEHAGELEAQLIKSQVNAKDYGG